MNGNRKGSAFERAICKQLSLWWSGGTRDDIFWRSCQSGGRATQRAKSGKETFGAYGDITAVDPCGLPLVEFFAIELKRGKSHGTPMDLIDCPEGAGEQPFEKTIEQAHTAAQQGGRLYWLLICQRDRRECMVYAPMAALHELDVLKVRTGTFTVRKNGIRVGFMSLRRFLAFVKPKSIPTRRSSRRA